MAISFVNQDVEFKLLQKQKLKRWIKLVIENSGKKLGNISYAFCSDKYIFEANSQFLGHTYFTDIITFDYCEGILVEGDILISIDTVGDNAKTYHVTFEEELHRVIIHGILHLIGFNDKTDQEQAQMTIEEDKALKLFASL